MSTEILEINGSQERVFIWFEWELRNKLLLRTIKKKIL